jgi:glycogen debranching enzyme
MARQKLKNPKPLDRSGIPEPVFDERPEWIDFYWKAWELAWDHVVEKEGCPQSPYMDEACMPDRIWIWDTCFMVQFCKYAWELFPGIESFQNFYEPMHDGAPTSMRIHHPDNPPLFAWIEYEYFRFTGDRERLERMFREKRYPQRHFEWFENLERYQGFPYGNVAVTIERVPDGYRWGSIQSGMDNTPRGRGDYDGILWVDALAQQGLAALYISRIADVLGDAETRDAFVKEYEERKALANRRYWCEEDGIYYDAMAESPGEYCRVKTPASYWPMLAEMCDAEQARRLTAHVGNASIMGGEGPWPSVSRDDPDYVPDGRYWRGGIWLPTAYMGTKALERYDFLELADATAENLLDYMYRTYAEYEPHTIWECYAPSEPKPAKGKKETYIVGPDFCGWSALGPISMFIENVLGFHRVDAVAKRVEWRKHRDGRHGIRRLRFGDVTADIVADGNTVDVRSSGPFTLAVNGRDFAISAGEQRLDTTAEET